MNPLDADVLFKIFKTSTKYPDRLIKREDKNHEFKQSFNMANAAMYLKTIAAFANNEGGYIIFGVKDKPHIYKQFYETSDSILAQIFRTSICYLDEVLNCLE